MTGTGDGVSIWRSREQLLLSRTHTRVVLGCLAVIAALWTLALTGGTGDGALDGFIVLEVLTLSPLVYTALRSHRLTREIRAADRHDAARPHPAVPAPPAGRETDDKAQQLFDRIGEMVASLDPGPLRDAGDDAARQARGILLVRSTQVRRLDQLTGIESLVGDHTAAGAVQESADTCLAHLADLDRALDALAASVAKLVNSAGAEQLQDALDELRGTTDRVAALSGAMDELRTGLPDGSASDPR